MKESSSYKQKPGAFSISSKVIDLYDGSIYDKKPNLDSIALTPEGNILIGGTWTKEDKKTYWLIDQKGNLLFKFALTTFDLTITGHFIFFQISDEDDNITVKFINRTKSEKEDLLNIEKMTER